jgi:hypothetical protein
MWLRPLLVCLGCLLVVRPCLADSPADPLRFLPASADLLIKIEKPSALFNQVAGDPLVGKIAQLEAVREAYDSTTARRFYQLLGYLERELAIDRWTLFENLTSGGAALAAQIDGEKSPVTVVIQGRDETLWRRALQIGLEVVEQELARKEQKERPVHTPYRRIDTVAIGKDFHAAVAGSALIFSNKEASLHQAIDCLLDPKAKSLATKPEVKQAHDLAGADASGWMWFNLPLVRTFPAAKSLFEMPRNDPNLTVLFGGWLDVAQHAPFLCAAGSTSAKESKLSFRMPRDLAKSAPAMRLNIPPMGAPGSRPLLEPKGVLFSSSFYLDLASLWENRAQLFNEAQRKAFEEFDKNSSKVLLGSTFSKLVTQTAPYHRVVVAHQPTYAYKTTPQQNIPAFAYAAELRDPEQFGKRIDAILRAAGLLASAATRLKPQIFEETYAGHKIVGYRFSESAPQANDPTNLRFNFVPCYVRVGNQFVACSTLNLCHDMIDLLVAEAKQPPATSVREASVLQFYGSGGAQILDYYKDVVLTQNILDNATTPDQANKQVNDLMQLVRSLGVFRIESRYSDKDFQYNLRFVPARK